MVESNPQDPVTPATKGPPKSRRRWMFRLAAVLLALSFFPVTEVVLRALNVGRNVNLVIPIEDNLLATTGDFTHQINGMADLAFYGTTDLSGPETRPFTLPRPDNTFRIVVVGGSTVIGFPYAPEFAFPRQLEMQLELQNPGLDVEVLNAGITAMNSFAVNELVAQCFDAKPDLVVIHTGHNEFYGPGGPASTAFQLSPELIRQTYHFRRWRSVQIVAALSPPPDNAGEDLLNVLPRQLSIPLNGPVYLQARTNYESNLRRMIKACRKSDTPVLLTTVACNLKDQSPLLAEWRNESIDGKVEWDSLLADAALLIQQRDYHAALNALERASDLESEHAMLSYRRGQCYDGLGDVQQAWAAFSEARDLDACRFRIPSEFHEIARRVADEHPHCHFLDLTAAMVADGYSDPPGYNLFLEHVHYNFEGHHLVGRLFAKFIQENIRSGRWNSDRVASSNEMQKSLGFLPEDDLAATSFAIEVLQTGPFAQTADRQSHIEFLTQRAGRLFELVPSDRRDVFAELSLNQMSGALPQHLLAEFEERGNKQAVELMRQCWKLRKPWLQNVP